MSTEDVPCKVWYDESENDNGRMVDSTFVSCSRCGYETSAWGTGDGSLKRCIMTLKNQCPNKEDNLYVSDTFAQIAKARYKHPDEIITTMDWSRFSKPSAEPGEAFLKLIQERMDLGRDGTYNLVSDQEKACTLVAELPGPFYLSGPAGSGKTHLIRYFADNYPGCRVTAMTGMASQLIAGVTTYRFAGIIPMGPRVVVRESKDTDERIRACTLLIVDEVSMASTMFLSQLYLRFMLAGYAPKLLVVGDFMQLPPVDKEKKGLIRSVYLSPDWARFIKLRLTTNHRQKDRSFLDALEQLRQGEKGAAVSELLLQRSVLELPEDCTQLAANKKLVQAHNDKMLAKLPEPHHRHVWETEEVKERNGKARQYNLKDARFRANLELRVGARVVLLTNNPPAWVNGSVGYVKHLPGTVIERVDGVERVVEAAEPYPPPPPTPVFIAPGAPKPKPFPLSIEEEERLSTKSLTRDAVDRIVAAGLEAPQKRKPREVTGLVITLTSGEQVEVPKQTEILLDPAYKDACHIRQYPVDLAWALTIHKSQGMSLDRVGVQMGNGPYDGHFATGQTYVAVSRCRTAEGLSVSGSLSQPLLVDSEALQVDAACEAAARRIWETYREEKQ